RRHTRSKRDWSSDVCSSDLAEEVNLNKLDQAVSIIFSLSGHSKEVDLSTDEVFTDEEERSITLLNQSGIKEKLTIGKQNDEGTRSEERRVGKEGRTRRTH